MSFLKLGLQTCYCFLPPGLLAILVPPALCLMMVPVITTEWLTEILSMTLDNREVDRADRIKRKKSIWFGHRRVKYGDETSIFLELEKEWLILVSSGI